VLRLYRSPASPYVRKVMVVLHETGQDGDIDYAAAQGTPLDSGQMPLAHNPLGKIPVLERSDGPALYDSRVICRYLDARAEAGLYPETGVKLWIEPRKRKWSRNSARSSKALASSWLPTTRASRLPKCRICAVACARPAGSVRVAKNRLAKIALEGKPCASIADLLTGMTVLAFSEDPVAAAKVVEDYAKANEIRDPWRGDGRNAARPAVSRRWPPCRRARSLSHRSSVHRGAGGEHRRGHWRTCFEHRGHPFNHRGRARSGLNARTLAPADRQGAALEHIPDRNGRDNG
jgi:hypothetical protein